MTHDVIHHISLSAQGARVRDGKKYLCCSILNASLPKAEQDEFMRVLHGLERCNELDVGDVKRMSVKGHG
jgi:hypothetical protein